MREPRKAIIHLLVPDDTGPIRSREMGRSRRPLRFSVACEPRAKLPKHASGEARAVTCQNCRATEKFERVRAIESGEIEVLELVDEPPSKPPVDDVSEQLFTDPVDHTDSTEEDE